MNENLIQAITIFLQGMAGIFVVMILIALTVYILTKITR